MPDFKVIWRKHVYALTIPSTGRPAPNGYKIVLLALAEYADWNTHNGAHPGTKRLSEDTGCSESTVQRALALGVELKLLDQKVKGHNTNRGQNLANSYNVTLPVKSQPGVTDMLTNEPESTGQSEGVNQSKGGSQPGVTDYLPTPTPTPTSTPKLEAHKLDARPSAGCASSSKSEVQPEAGNASSSSGVSGSFPQASSALRVKSRQTTSTRKCPYCSVMLDMKAPDATLLAHLQSHEELSPRESSTGSLRTRQRGSQSRLGAFND